MDKQSFFNLFCDFDSVFHLSYPYHYLSVKPFCICIESEGFNNGEMDSIFSFFTDRKLEFLIFVSMLSWCSFNIHF